MLHGHHDVTFNPTSTDSEHVLGRYTRSVVKEVYSSFFGAFKPTPDAPYETSTVLARVTLSNCFAFVGISDEMEVRFGRESRCGQGSRDAGWSCLGARRVGWRRYGRRRGGSHPAASSLILSA